MRKTLSLLILAALPSIAAVTVARLQVEYRDRPMGIDVARPRFGWQMSATAGERGITQTAYQLEVRGPDSKVVWDSGRVESSTSVGVQYAGAALQPASRYGWTVSAWDQAGTKRSATSWFETGLMDPSPAGAAWSGAQWIGGRDGDLPLYAHYLAVFDLSYAVTIAPGSSRASFVFGANDSRLLDKYKNIYQVESGKDGSYIRLELDIAGLDGASGGKAMLKMYRAGYKDTDTADRPIHTLEISREVIHDGNKNAEHVIAFSSAYGQITVTVDGKSSLAPAGASQAAPPTGFGMRTGPNTVNLNPVGSGGDYLPFGLLCDIGFSVPPGQSASFRNLVVRNNRAPRNVLFEEDLGASPYKGIFSGAAAGLTVSGLTVTGGRYNLAGGSAGVFIVRDPSRNAMPMLRTTFKIGAKPVRKARLYVTARGIYEVFLNGKRVGDDSYNPGLTQYNVTHMYQTYDVTSLVKPGENALGAMLGEGWWSGQLSFGTVWNHFGDRQSLLAKLVITYGDGSADVVTSSERSWKFFGDGPVRYSSLNMGEVYDASREAAVAGWSTAAYNDSGWKPAVVVPLAGTTFSGAEQGRPGGPATPFHFDKLSLVGQIGNNAGVFRTVSARSVKEVRPGVFVYDLGQNIVGVPRITIANGTAGRRITLRFAEMLYPDLKESGKNVGMIMTENYRAALSQDLYTMKAGPQVLQPRFTFHGFQYVEITGIDRPLPVEAVQGVVISSVRELSAGFQSSNAKVNRLWSNLVWSNVDNFLSIPTDCPQRNERMGWSGDINVFSRTATYVSNANQFLTRHMLAMRDVQLPNGKFTDIAPVGGGFGGVLWGSAGIVIPWEVYQQYGDKGILEQNYQAMAAYMAYLETTIDPNTGLTSDAALGDWLGPQNNALGSAFLATAYHAHDLEIMSRVATILGKEDDAAKYRGIFEKRKAFFNEKFVNAEKKTLGTSGGRGGFGQRGAAPAPVTFRVADTQTSYAVGLGMGLFDEANKPQMVRNLADTVARSNKDDGGIARPPFSLMTGFIGTAWISKALSDHGLDEHAYRLLQNNQYPSWLYPIDQGATSIWERLNGYTVENGFGGNNSMNSFNHYSFGAVGQWMMAYSLGIQRDEPGFKRFILQPTPDPTGAMTSAEGYYDSVYGRIASAWKVTGKLLTYRATVPPNTTATLILPVAAAADVKEGNKPVDSANGVKLLRQEGGRSVFSLASGSYAFTAPWPAPAR